MQLRDYQSAAVDAALVWIKYKDGINGYVVAPGGSGKSHMISAVAQACYDMGKRKILILARSEKLLRQNKAKFAQHYQEHIGIYCSGLQEWNLHKPITVASIQSICNESHAIKPEIILVDECDEISPDSDDETQYSKFFNGCGNPQIIGFTATPFRTKEGTISWGEEIINIPLKPLIDQGFLVPPINKVGGQPDLSKIKVTLGEYSQSQLEQMFADPELLELSVQRIKQHSAKRNSVLIFAQSIKHANILSDVMELNDMPSKVVDGTTQKDYLSSILDAFERREFKYLINCNLLTVGYDMPCVDMIAVVRATISKRLFEQMVYRGTRLYNGKKDFLLLDMGGNLMRHGPLGSPFKKKNKKKEEEEEEENENKICPACETLCNKENKTCPDCGYEFIEDKPRKISHDDDGDTESQTIYDPFVTYNVTGVNYRIHIKQKTGTKSLRVDYLSPQAPYGAISEWIAMWSDSDWARQKAWKFFDERGKKLASDTKTYSEDDILWHSALLKQPKQIVVDTSGEFKRITKYIYEENRSDNTKRDSEMAADLLDGDVISF
jgi:DNA repair protein RadD